MPRNPSKELEVLDESSVRAVAEAMSPTELSAERRASMRARVMSRVRDLQPRLTETIHTESIPWRSVSPGVHAKLLKRDDAANLMIVLWRLEPGGTVAGHPHADDEECLVLEGEMLVGAHRVRAGELHIAKPGAIHADLTTRTGCVVLVRSGVSPLLTSLLAT